MVVIKCPKCNNAIKIRPKDGYYVDFDLDKANENRTCANCNRTISYSIRKQEQSEKKN